MGGGQLFDRDNLQLDTLTIIMVSLIVFTILFELALHWLEHKLLHTMPLYHKVMNKVFKELMILGFVSFSLLLTLEFGNPPQAELIMFEFAHVWIFVLALLFVCHAIVLLKRMTKSKKIWEETDAIPTAELLTQHEEFASKHQKWYRSHWLYLLFGRTAETTRLEFHLARSFFFKVNDLPRSFSFSWYLRACMDHAVVDHLDIEEASWLFLMVILGLNVLRSYASGVEVGGGSDHTTSSQRKEELWYFFAVGWALFLLDLLLLVQVRRAKARFLAKADCKDITQLPNALTKALAEEESNERSVDEEWRLMAKYTNTFLTKQEAEETEKQKQAFDGVFFFGRPGFYSKAAEIIMLFQCFILGLVFLLNMRMAWKDFGKAGGILFILSALLPQALIMFVVSPAVLREHIFLVATCALDEARVAEVAEWMTETQDLKDQFVDILRKKVCEAKSDMSPREALVKLFTDIDTDGDGHIDYDELKHLLHHLDLDVHAGAFTRLVQALDRTNLGYLGYKEFADTVQLPKGSGASPVRRRRGSSSVVRAKLIDERKERFATCFPEQLLCNVCGRYVAVRNAEDHVGRCVPASSEHHQAVQIKEEAKEQEQEPEAVEMDELSV